MDKRSITSAINGKKGGRPRELEDWDGGLPEENWRPIEGFESYFISDYGRILSVKFEVLRILKPNPQKKYPRAFLCKNGKVFPFLVHRLTLLAFRGSPPPGCEGSHIDGNPENGHLNNLIWETPKENNARKHEHGTENKGEINGQAKLTENDVLEIRKLSSDGMVQWKIAEKYGVKQGTISLIIIGKNWKHI